MKALVFLGNFKEKSVQSHVKPNKCIYIYLYIIYISMLRIHVYLKLSICTCDERLAVFVKSFDASNLGLENLKLIAILFHWHLMDSVLMVSITVYKFLSIVPEPEPTLLSRGVESSLEHFDKQGQLDPSTCNQFAKNPNAQVESAMKSRSSRPPGGGLAMFDCDEICFNQNFLQSPWNAWGSSYKFNTVGSLHLPATS